MDNWIGHYEGYMFLEFPDRKIDSLKISLDIDIIEKGESWTQKFRYFSEKYRDILKDYVLKVNTKYSDGQHYFLDEKNGILIDEIMLNNTLFSQYEVENNYYQTRLEKKDNSLYFEIVCSKSEGGTASKSYGEDEVFDVKSTLIYTIQFAELFKK
jgi:hypothetical protein